MAHITTILLPTRPQPDTIVAIFLLRTFAEAQFPGVGTARVDIKHSIDPSETFESLTLKGFLPIDVGGGPFDHHAGDFCASELVAKFLCLDKDPSLTRLLQYARRDDKEGKGTLSTDGIDRAFGLSGLIASLNKMHTQDPHKIVEVVLPLLEAHYLSAREHHVLLPKEIEEKKRSGKYIEKYVTQSGKKIKMGFVISDKPSMPTYLRSQQGPRLDIVVQKTESTNHVCVLSRQDRGIDLSSAAALIRLREGQLQGLDLGNDQTYLGKSGRIDEVPHWYFDPATNSLLNGGPHNTAVQESCIDWDEMKRIVDVGIEIGGAPQSIENDSTYYFSIKVPEDSATRILSNLAVASDVKIHAAKNLHITLEYLGTQSAKEAARIADIAKKVFADKNRFDIFLMSTQFTLGTPEGYSRAWFLHVEPEHGGDKIDALRQELLPALGRPSHEKMHHVTLGVKRSDAIPDTAVTVSQPFELEVSVTEVILVENANVGGKRVYKTHSTFSLQ